MKEFLTLRKQYSLLYGFQIKEKRLNLVLFLVFRIDGYQNPARRVLLSAV